MFQIKLTTQKQHHRQLLYVSIQIPSLKTSSIAMQLPLWRPGRYESANYPKNIFNVQLQFENGDFGEVSKITSHQWLCETNGQLATLTYSYFANQPDAGGSFVTADWVYVNPVNCIMYPVETNYRLPVSIDLSNIDLRHIAIGATETSKRVYEFTDFDSLFDTPFMLADQFDKISYTIDEYSFSIVLWGAFFADLNLVKKHFENFTKTQLQLFSKLPTPNFTFLVIALPYSYYHGVEHKTSTVIVLGPSDKFNEKSVYQELVGVSSHELFHVWNIKSIRPTDMLPYNYNQMQFSKLGYVYEGFTTYYGDLMLARSGFFNLNEYLKEINNYLGRHFTNDGRLFANMHQSSIDTWVDGYGQAAPNRRVSIYAEGMLHALCLDLIIRQTTNNLHSLDDIMQWLEVTYGNTQDGYTEDAIFAKIVALTNDNNLMNFPKNYFSKPALFETLLPEPLQWVGLCLIDIEKSPSNRYGVTLKYSNGKQIVSAIDPNSDLCKEGMAVGCSIDQVNNKAFNPNKPHIWEQFWKESPYLSINWTDNIGRNWVHVCEPDSNNIFVSKAIVSVEKPTKEQLQNRKNWLTQY